MDDFSTLLQIIVDFRYMLLIQDQVLIRSTFEPDGMVTSNHGKDSYTQEISELSL
jgi:hypothetical protein